ncbi:glycoside hydrolase family 15 protein [Streptomyces sp. NTH33]|uniref:glycoside hydrolase family 15 protein n=1 Tax=Streptomyces sp. NTH33 TaxID=1735453 RepID=UPI000DA76FC2|nr:glycoside hydrolase family 15 protein [Streptomyces sp. NTH33]PZH09024.1 glycoside hydrolase family 15 protein [Streptomyces sp. NTH33]
MTPHRTDGFLPLRDYALIGDMRGAALVAADGCVDWFAAAAMDAAPLCAALLDPGAGGRITLAPTVPYQVSRRYLPGTLVLETTYTTAQGTVRVTDALNLGALGLLPWTELARLVTVEDGEVPLAWSVQPGHRLTPGSRPWSRREAGTPVLVAGDQYIAVVADGIGDLSSRERALCGLGTVRAGRPGVLAVLATEGEPLHLPSPHEIRDRLDDTVATWRRWSQHIRYKGPWRDSVLRSALTLKALTFQPTGAIVGAATTSLPERIGGDRNFDYRFSWIRDSSYSLDAMGRLGLSEELHAGLSWLLGAAARTAPDLRPFFTLRSEPASARMEAVPGVPGYRHSPPVHVGNSAAAQCQTGSYGDLLDAVWRYTLNDGRLDTSTGHMVGALADRVCDLWRTPDSGFWELDDPQHYTSSKIGCWLALDRAVRLSEAGQLSSPRSARWRLERADLRSWIDQHCWSPAKQCYTFHAGTTELDAAVLLAARTGFCQGDDPRLHTTVEAVRAELGAQGPLLYRYSGQREKEGAFLACSFWLVEALTHAGRTDEAATLLDSLVALANDVGLYTEQVDPVGDELLGNLPQALTHLTLIGAADALTTAMAGR